MSSIRGGKKAAAITARQSRKVRPHTRSLTVNTTIVVETPPRARATNTNRRGRSQNGTAARVATDHVLEATIEASTEATSAAASAVLDPGLLTQPRNCPIVPLVDLVTPSATSRTQRIRLQLPLEVDLTCDHDLDDEPIVVLEDISSHLVSVRETVIRTSVTTDTPVPVILGQSPPQSRNQSSISHYVPERVPASGIPHSSERDQSKLSDLSGLPVPSTSAEPLAEIQCPICLDGLTQIKREGRQLQSTTCGHLFCKSCITQAILQTKQCPTCRQALTLRKIHPLFI